MIDDMKTGILVQPRNAKAIKSAIKEVYENRELLYSMSQSITDEWRTGKRSWDSITDGLIDIYKDILQK
jgi:glycosyltransferase involved in cell wall biosynthesis